ncbi:hypothetical protein QEN58_04880 [Halomonas alkaliantarctica]|uniref:DUF8051 domain-containing protein n=1 Tax=Halomonas alkaliantarctica TaxID=232346 RepID=A0ABY8LSW6_9GAMM|nr:hypothetical protein [Halomonas alkaliantarctica]WGI26403.1 hypothetical protein QEN58_04880 [Halomonas alkaliantarctica]
MENYIGYAVAGLLALSAALLSALIPGGPIENRNFSHISPLKLGMFNVFLTVLGIGSFALVYFSIVGAKPAFIAAALCGISYLLVYALDLTKIFPVSPDRMPRALFWIEVVGFVLSIPLTFLSLANVFISKGGVNASGITSNAMIIVLVIMVFLGGGIVIFATKAAMRKSPKKANSADAKKRMTD